MALKSSSRAPKVIIFDFDGTIANTFGTTIHVFKKRFVAKRLLNSFGIKWWQVPVISNYIKRVMRGQLQEAAVFSGMEGALSGLRKAGHRLWIVSSNSQQGIEAFLEHHNLSAYFEGLLADQGVFKKARTLKRVARKCGVEPKRCVYVGDEVRDMQAAQAAGTQFLGVAWGNDSHQTLQAAGAKVVVDHPKQLVEVLQ